MSRYSPTVLPESGPGFGDFARSLADSLDQRRTRKRQEHQDQEADEDRRREHTRQDRQDAWTEEQHGQQKLLDAISLYNSGYREGAPPTGDPSTDLAAAIAGQRGNRTQGQDTYAEPAQPQRGNATQTGEGADALAAGLESRRARPAGFGNTTAQGTASPQASAPSPVTQLGQKFYSPPGASGYFDLDQTPEARTARQKDADDRREHGQHLEDLGVEHGYREGEGAASDQRRHAGDLELEDRRHRGDMEEEALRSRRENATTARTADEETAQGAAFLKSVGAKGKDDPLIAAFGRAFQGVREANPKWHPGRVAFQAQKMLKASRPDLFPQPPARASTWTQPPPYEPEQPDASGRPALSAEEKQRARTDAGFREFLAAKGYKEGDY